MPFPRVGPTLSFACFEGGKRSDSMGEGALSFACFEDIVVRTPNGAAKTLSFACFEAGEDKTIIKTIYGS